jgi:hypothetical protein
VKFGFGPASGLTSLFEWQAAVIVTASKTRFIASPRGALDHGESDEVNALVTPVQPSRLAVTFIAVACATALAHVAPAVDDNNKYFRLTPLGDRVRLAYTVFFGEVPGAIARKAIDANGDGKISEAEAHAFGVALSGRVAAGLELTVEGAVRPIQWQTIDVGMGTPDVAAGSFSVDLVTYACFATPRGHHHIHVRDRFAVERPGESEAMLEDSPGVDVVRARVGALDDPSHDYRFAGPDGPLADDGFDVEVEATERSIVAPDATCPAIASSRSPVLVVALAVLAVLAGGCAFFVVRRRKRA